MSRETDLAWAAGFFDGEGSSSFFVCYSKQRNGPRPNLRCSISQKDPRVLYRFKEIVGFGSINGPYGGEHGLYEGTYRYNAGGSWKVHKVAQLLWPYLDIVKKQQFNRNIQAWKNRKTHIEAWHSLRELREPE